MSSNRRSLIVFGLIGGGDGHVSRDCTQEAKAKTCYKCGEEGHIVRRRITLLSYQQLIFSFSLGNVLTAPTPTPDINQVANATAVAKLGTSRAHALKTPLGVEAVDTTIAEDFPRRLGLSDLSSLELPF